MFAPRDDARQTAAARALKVIARVLFEAHEDDVVVVNELRCTEPGCPPLETVVALLRSGSAPRQVKVHKPVIDVTHEELRVAILGLADTGHCHAG